MRFVFLFVMSLFLIGCSNDTETPNQNVDADDGTIEQPSSDEDYNIQSILQNVAQNVAAQASYNGTIEKSYDWALEESDEPSSLLVTYELENSTSPAAFHATYATGVNGELNEPHEEHYYTADGSLYKKAGIGEDAFWHMTTPIATTERTLFYLPAAETMQQLADWYKYGYITTNNVEQSYMEVTFQIPTKEIESELEPFLWDYIDKEIGYLNYKLVEVDEDEEMVLHMMLDTNSWLPNAYDYAINYSLPDLEKDDYIQLTSSFTFDFETPINISVPEEVLQQAEQP